MKPLFFLIFVVVSCLCDEFSLGVKKFSDELLSDILKENTQVVISPVGVWSLLTGVALRATDNSKFQLYRALFLPNDPPTIIQGYKNITKTVLDPMTEGVTLTSKNLVFIDQGLTIDSLNERTMVYDFDEIVQNLNFNEPDSKATVANDDTQRSSVNKSNVLKSDNVQDSRIILSNVVKFKGLWATSFNKTETANESFYDENYNRLGYVKMMYQRAQWPFTIMPDLKSRILEVPYGQDGKYCMLIILPNHKVKATDVYENLKNTSLLNIFQKLQKDIEDFGLEDIDVNLPRFKVSTNIELKNLLNRMDVYDIFDRQVANIEAISAQQIHASEIIHKAEIEVTEEGMADSIITPSIFPDRTQIASFKMNRPFIYFVMEKPTITVILGGIYSMPNIF